MRIGIIGCGTIASAVVRGIAEDGHQITVSERSKAQSTALAQEFSSVSVAADLQALLDTSDVVFLGLMAETALELLPTLRFREGQVVISFMAGATLAQVQTLVSPAHAPALMLPFPSIAQGGSPILVQGDSAAIAEIFGVRNSLFSVEGDAEMAAYLCAQAVLSPVTRMVGDAAAWMEGKVGDPAEAERFLRMLVASSLSGNACAPLIEALNTPGGYNQRLRVHMEEAGMRAALAAGLDDLA